MLLITSLFSLYFQFGTGGGSLSLALPLVLIGVMYVLLFLPMQRQKKQTAKMLSELKSGDTVVTTGGIVGTLVSLEKDTVIMRVKPDNLKLQFSRSAISGIVPPTDVPATK